MRNYENVVHVLKIIFSKSHCECLDITFDWVFKAFLVVTKVNNHESKSKTNDHQEHGNEISGQFLDDIVEHDAEVSTSEWVSANYKDQFEPSCTDT